MNVPRFLRSRDRVSAFALAIVAALLPAVALPRIPVPEQRINALIGSTVADHRNAALTTTSGGEFTLLAYLENGSVYGQVRFGRQSTWQKTAALAGPSAGQEPVTEFQMAQTDDSWQGVSTVLIASRTTNGSAISISLMNRNGLRTRGESAVITPPDGIAKRLRLATYRQKAALCFIGGNTDQTYCTFSADTGSGSWSKLRLMSTHTGALNTSATAVAYDHAGRLFVAWAETSAYFPTGVSLATSPNNGVSFGSPAVLNSYLSGGSELHLVIAN